MYECRFQIFFSGIEEFVDFDIIEVSKKTKIEGLNPDKIGYDLYEYILYTNNLNSLIWKIKLIENIYNINFNSLLVYMNSLNLFDSKNKITRNFVLKYKNIG